MYILLSLDIHIHVQTEVVIFIGIETCVCINPLIYTISLFVQEQRRSSANEDDPLILVATRNKDIDQLLSLLDKGINIDAKGKEVRIQ
jgi:hypothetical protein